MERPPWRGPTSQHHLTGQLRRCMVGVVGPPGPAEPSHAGAEAGCSQGALPTPLSGVE